MTDDSNRFSDADFYTQLKQDKIKDLESQKKLIETINSLSANVEMNRKSIELLSAETSDLVSAWKDAQGAIRVVAWIGSAIKWLGGLGVIYYAFLETIKHIDKVK